MSGSAALPSIDGSVTEWTNDMFSAELQAAIRDIVPVTDKDFDKHDFNPVAYINDNFSNEQSLTRLDNFMNRLKLKIIKIDEEIIQEVRLQSISGGKGKEDLENAKRSIQELLTKITDIKSKANQSEQMVTEICKDIKSLDYAKKNLTTAITTLKRLHMMVMGVEQLKEMVEKKQYGTVAKLLEATAQFAEGFKDYRESPKIYALNKELDNIRSKVKDQIYEDFKNYIPYTSNQIKPNEENRWKSSCYVIDALGSEVKKDFLRWFCEVQLSSYKSAFGIGSEHYSLDSTERRFAWWSRQIKTFREEYALVFPPEWCMEEQISYEFCISTRLALSEILLTNKNSIEVPALIKALKKTLNFENKLYEMFASNNQKLSSPNMSSTTPSYESDRSDNDDSDDDDYDDSETHSNNNNIEDKGGNSGDAIRRRWEAKEEKNKRREEEKLQQQQGGGGKFVEQQKPIEIPKSYERFKGIISTSFDPYMDLYINEEDKLMGEVLDKVISEEKWTLSDEESNKILSSCTDLVFHFIKVRNRCAELTKNEPFFNLYHLFRKYLTQYANIISSKIHTDVGRPHDVTEDKTICLIINTAEFCRKTSGQMTDGFKKIIEEKYKELIDLKDIQNDFSSLVAKGVKSLVSGIEAKLDPHLQSMTRMEWGERYQYVGDNSPYVNEVVNIISESTQLELHWLSSDHYKYFCDLFAGSFVLRITQSIYKCRGISEIGSQGILLDITTIKSVLLDLPNKVKDGRSNNRYTKLVNKEFSKAENLLKVIGCSKDHLVETFKDLFPDSSNADFQKIMDLKGYKVGDKIQTELFEKLSKVSTNIGASIKTKFFN